MKRRISVQTGGVFEHCGIDEGMRLLAEAGFDCVDLGLNSFLMPKTIREGAVQGEFTLPVEGFIDKHIRTFREAGEK